MPYRVVVDPPVRERIDRLSPRDRLKFEEIRAILSRAPYPGENDGRRRRLDFEGGLSIYSYVVPTFPRTVIYTIQEPENTDDTGVVRIITVAPRAD